MQKIKVLFVCIHNSARSQMAHGYLNALAPEAFEAKSAGIEPGNLNPFAVRAMAEAGIDISQHVPAAVAHYLETGEHFDYVVTVCDGASGERCPIFPGATRRLHWEFPDPSALKGTDDEKLSGTRVIRDTIKARIEQWLATKPEQAAAAGSH